MASPPTLESRQKQQEILCKIVLRRCIRRWASKSAQERNYVAENLEQLFYGSSSLSSSSLTASPSAPRRITRRPNAQEIKTCVLYSVCPCFPPSCDALRAEIWQVLLDVSKRSQLGAAAYEQHLERTLQRVGKLPRDALLCRECRDVATSMPEPMGAAARDKVQQELEVLLMWFLTTKSVAYVTGMARVVASFVGLQMPLPTVYDCFYQFCATFVPHFVVADTGSATDSTASLSGGPLSSSRRSSNASGDETGTAGPLRAHERSGSVDSTSSIGEERIRCVDDEETQTLNRERQQLVDQLLSYHAPHLAHCLNQWCGNEWSEAGKLIAADFLIGHLYQVVSPSAFVYVIDQYLLTGDSLFGLFIVTAAIIARQDVLLSCESTEEVQTQIRATFDAKAFADEENVRYVCLLASRLRSKTPKTYMCSQREATVDMRCSSRQAIEIAFGSEAGVVAEKMRSMFRNRSTSAPSSGGLSAPSSSDRKSATEAAVDMSQWAMKESRSIAGKIFWYHTKTGKTQWEHPAEKHDPPSAYFALPISVKEVGAQLIGGSEKAGDHQQDLGSSNIRFFVVDCRGLRSSGDLKSGRIPVAYTLDPSVFDSPELLAKSMEAFDPMKSQVHVVLVGHGVGIPPELVSSEDVKTSIRDAVRLDVDCLNQAALFFQKRGFRFVSTLDGGYSSWHAFMRDRAGSSPQELLDHVTDQCVYCRYDTILRTGEDPLKKIPKQKKSRRKKTMPTMTSMPVNGGDGDASITSTSESTLSNSGSSGRSSARSGRRQLSISRKSITSMRSKLAEVSIPKKWGWRRRSSGTANNQNDSGSSSEAATAEDGGSDHGSITDDLEQKFDEATHEMLRAALEEPDYLDMNGADTDASQDAKFEGVFTIDYSDDEIEDKAKEKGKGQVANDRDLHGDTDVSNDVEPEAIASSGATSGAGALAATP
uniref:TBC1 domain family member 23 n=1 Tax=Hyaloperonospora arabidopsidis (strain Emoy2) TaxID=559515 RepID=M4BC04_HYAAE